MDIIDISSGSESKTNFGGGIELLMNEKKKEGPGDNIKLNNNDDLDNLENELNELSDIGMSDKFVSKTDIFNPTIESEPLPSVKFQDINEPPKTENMENNTTWDGYSKFNDVPIYPETPVQPQMNKEELLREKFKVLRKLESLEEKGVNLSKKYTMDSSLNEMQGEYETIMDEKAKSNSIKFQGNMLMACINGIEFLNGRFDPFDIKLDGWSDQVNENINDYDEVFGELHEKYQSKASMAPELKLLFQLGGSAMMVHMTNTMFKSSMPGMDDILRQNPDLMQQFQSAAANSMSQSNPGFSGFMNNVVNNDNSNSNGPPPPMSTQGYGAPPPPQNRGGNNNYNSRVNANMGRSSIAAQNDGINISEQFEPAMSAPKSSRTSRPEMKGPSDIDDILSGLKTKTIDIQQTSGKPSTPNESSTISISDLKELQGTDANLPKKTKRRQKSDKNTLSLDI